MSKIEDLIQEYCPDGVTTKTINELLTENTITLVTPSKKVKKNDFQAKGKTPIISQELEYISGFTDLVDSKIGEDQYVCFGDHSEHIKYIDFAFVQGADGLKIIKSCDKNVNMRYLYHACLNFYKRYDNYERHFKYFREISIPVPPLNVQEEIVRVLDEYTDVTNSLVNELTAELEARKKQYEYYRNNVFDSITNYGVYKLEELCDVITKQTGFDYSSTIKPSLLTEKIEGTYSFIQNKDFSGTNISFNTDYYIPINIANSFPKILIDRPSILISISGKIGNIGFYDFQEKAFIGGAIAICKLKKEVSGKYIMYYLMSGHGQRYLFKSVKAASHLNITVESIRKTKILLPPLDEQQAIVDILDRFDALCNDITSDLSAEIEARKKQYEYYRDKLLTFKEKK